MKRALLTFGLFFLLQQADAQEDYMQKNDSVVVVQMKNVNVDKERNWSNDTVRYRYNQLKYYVTTILPYLDAAAKMLAELEAKEHTPGISKKELRSFVNIKETEIHERFDNEISKLNETQGVLLIKLVARQSGMNIYDKLQEYKSGFYALRWQTWAKLHGFNLNRQYSPDDEPMLEHIMEQLGYPLPPTYTRTINPDILQVY